ncbi:MAG: sigma-70 family RNA polymerase sigma factor [Verrucomicrobia bacterium]|nr:sigma-70 family RNA polymerase sigma factor [Verrucomicrobiota bacterium]
MPSDPRHDQFLRLFLSCQPRIFAYIRSLVFSRADADDVLQETALVLWEKFDQYEPGTHFDRWAYRIAHFQILAHRQNKARDRLQFGDHLIERLADEMVAEGDRHEASHDALTQCLAKLPEGDRDLIRQRYRPGGTNRDVAQATGRSESVISRALNRIRTALLLCIEGTLLDRSAPADMQETP